MATGAQLAERRRISEASAAAASQDSNDKPAEVEVSERDEDEGDPTDVEADLEETTAMAMRDEWYSVNACLHGHGGWHRKHLHRLASAVARILQQTSGPCLQRPSARLRTALSEWATGARSAGTCFPISTHRPCTVCIGV